jgi:hypothetical protein
MGGGKPHGEEILTALKIELEHFDREQSNLLREHENRFVLIKGTNVIGAYDTETQAYEAGVQKFGDEPFLVKQVTKDEPTHDIPALRLGLLGAQHK